MCMTKGTRPVRGQLSPTSSNYSTGLVTPAMLMYGATTLRALGELRAVSATFGGKLGYRTSAVLNDRPDAWTDSGTVRSTADNFAEDFSLTAITGKLWIQARWAGAASSGAAEALASVSAMVDAEQTPLALARVEVEPVTNSSQTGYVVVGGRVAALGLAGVMAGVRLTGASGTLTYGLAMRTYKAEGADPSTWTDLATYSNITADELRKSGDLAVTPGTNGLVEFAIKVSGTDARGTLDLLLAGRWS